MSCIRQTGSRESAGLKMCHTVQSIKLMLTTKYQQPVISSCKEKCDKNVVYVYNTEKFHVFGKQEVENQRI